MMLSTRSLSVAIALLGLLAGDGSPSFEDGLTEVHRAMERERWDDARALLGTLLERHEGDAAVLLRIATVREDLMRCAFWSSYERPDPKTLISGELLAWGAASGKIKLRYAPDRLGDFEERDALRLHPLTFDGDYTVEVEWKPPHLPGNPLPIVAVGIGSKHNLGVILGRETVEVAERGTRRWTQVATAPFKSRVTLIRKDDAIEVLVDGKRVEKREFEPDGYGHVLLANVESLSPEVRLTITGNGQASWLQRVVDDAVRKAWEEFEEGYAIEQDLPQWILDAERLAEASVGITYPGPRSEAQDALWEEVWTIVDERRFGDLKQVEGRLGDGCTDAFKDFVQGYLRIFDGEIDQARACSERLLAADPDNIAVRLLAVAVMNWSGAEEEALASLRTIRAEHPAEPVSTILLARALMRSGLPDEARELMREALQAGAPVASLAPIHSMLGKYERGPEWGKTHVHESAHYRVRSDIDPQICYDAGRQLEAAWRVYSRDLGRVPQDGRLSEVFLFSGETGYRAYAIDVLDEAAHNTLGLYTPTLKQLLIWNAPEREQMMGTVRHEGFHQYLDRLVDVGEVPRWLNEGMAEYYEPLDPLAGETERGQVHWEHVETLRPWVLQPVEEVIHSTPGAFYRMSFAYPRAWLLVHYLQHSGERERAVFDDLWRRLLAGETREEALAGAFAGVDMAELQKGVTLHLRTLERQAR